MHEKGRNVDTLRAMQYFIRTADLGSLSAAAREQGTTQSTVSKVLDALEKQLQVRLLERRTTGLVLTNQGQRFYERAKLVLEEYESAVLDARGLTERPSGLLKINAPVALGQARLNTLVHQFLGIYPDISVELILNDRFVDLVEEGVDVAIRLGVTLPQDAIARRLAVSRRILVASPAYLRQHGEPERPEDLERHAYVRFAWAPDGDRVELNSGAKVVSIETHGRYRVNNALSIRESLVMGAGIGLCPVWLVHDLLGSSQLTHVLPDWSGPLQELFLIYPSRRYLPLRSKLFIDFMSVQLPALPGFLPGRMG